MSIRVILVVAGCVLATAAAIAGDPFPTAMGGNFRADLTGAEEVPAVSTAGHGGFQAKLSDGELSYEMRYEGLTGSPNMAHIHFGAPFTAGGVIAFLCGGGNKPACPASPGTVSGTIVAADVVGPAGQGIGPGEFEKLARAMVMGLTYVNVHTAAFPSGEIRGGIRRRPNRHLPVRPAGR